MSTGVTTPPDKTRITVEIYDDDYRTLRMASARAGKGMSVSRLVREVIHEWAEQAQDEADRALATERLRDLSPDVPGDPVRARLAARRSGRQGA
ncbi:MAG: hypothetical protein LBJ08_03555 [Bifidobacteriaceae bacterium]|jgi:hypothetical protein|nr:hypothetical protein [Bifidobacteriaceae bacterium]